MVLCSVGRPYSAKAASSEGKLGAGLRLVAAFEVSKSNSRLSHTPDLRGIAAQENKSELKIQANALGNV
jgi:hypothetical protein